MADWGTSVFNSPLFSSTSRLSFPTNNSIHSSPDDYSSPRILLSDHRMTEFPRLPLLSSPKFSTSSSSSSTSLPSFPAPIIPETSTNETAAPPKKKKRKSCEALQRGREYDMKRRAQIRTIDGELRKLLKDGDGKIDKKSIDKLDHVSVLEFSVVAIKALKDKIDQLSHLLDSGEENQSTSIEEEEDADTMNVVLSPSSQSTSDSLSPSPSSPSSSSSCCSSSSSSSSLPPPPSGNTNPILSSLKLVYGHYSSLYEAENVRYQTAILHSRTFFSTDLSLTIIDSEGRVIDVSQSEVASRGLTRERIIGKIGEPMIAHLHAILAYFTPQYYSTMPLLDSYNDTKLFNPSLCPFADPLSRVPVSPFVQALSSLLSSLLDTYPDDDQLTDVFQTAARDTFPLIYKRFQSVLPNLSYILPKKVVLACALSPYFMPSRDYLKAWLTFFGTSSTIDNSLSNTDPPSSIDVEMRTTVDGELCRANRMISPLYDIRDGRRTCVAQMFIRTKLFGKISRAEEVKILMQAYDILKEPVPAYMKELIEKSDNLSKTFFQRFDDKDPEL